MARRNQTYTDDQRAVALSFLERLHGDYAVAARKSDVEVSALRVWHAEELTGKVASGIKPATQPATQLATQRQTGEGLGEGKPPAQTPPLPHDAAYSGAVSPIHPPLTGEGESRRLRPYPPEALMDPERWPARFEPAHNVMDWMKAAMLEEGSPLYDADQWHLSLATIGVLWTNIASVRAGQIIMGTAEIPLLGGKGKWAKGREAQQLTEWFGDVPDFLMTLDSVLCGAASDRAFCRVVDHENRHFFYKTDDEGEMRTDLITELPSWTLRGHCVEEFVRIGELYGAEACAGRSVDFHAALSRRPHFTDEDIAKACGRLP